MNKEELFKTMFLSNKGIEGRFRDTPHYDDGGWSDLWKQISKQAREERLEREKVFGKTMSKYHR